MTKAAAFGTTLDMGTGAVQVETATVAGEITNPGNLEVIITAAHMTGSALTLNIPVINGVAAVSAAAIRDYLNSNVAAAAVRAMFYISGATDKVILTRHGPFANDASLNIALATGSATGLTAAPTSDPTTAGETLSPIAYIKNIGGPGLSVDTADVTTHDSPGAFEEVVATIIRTGELSLDLVYDPNEGTHDASTGLLYYYQNKTLVGFEMTFPGSVVWAFPAYITGFEPSAPHDDALTATAKLKLTGAPVLA